MRVWIVEISGQKVRTRARIEDGEGLFMLVVRRFFLGLGLGKFEVKSGGGEHLGWCVGGSEGLSWIVESSDE